MMNSQPHHPQASQIRNNRRSFHLKLIHWLASGVVCSLGTLGWMATPQPALAGDRLTTYIGPLQISMDIDDLEVFANEGKAQGNVKLLARRLNETRLNQFRQLLQRKFKVNSTTVSRLFYTPIAESLLQRMGTVIETNSGLNGFYAMRSAMILAADEQSPDGFTIIDVLRHYPTQDIRIDLETALKLRSEIETLFAYTRTSVQAVEQAAAQEASEETELPIANLPDLRQLGTSPVDKYEMTFAIEAIRETPLGIASQYNMAVDIYVPHDLVSPAPVIVLTHGFDAGRDNYEYLSNHLASHGFVVAAPEHVGSDLQSRQSLLEGSVSSLISPIEYISRPLDISYLLDELEQLATHDPGWSRWLNLEQVGIVGYSFGGTTALSSAGATFDVDRLRSRCADQTVTFSPSVLILCRAQYLPPEEYDLADPRIKAVLAAYPLTSLLFGSEGMSTISVPTLILSGSQDIIAPTVPEQIYPFLWLTTPHKYLGLMVPGTHFSTSDVRYSGQYPEAIRGPNTAIGQDYLRSLSVAFFQTYLNNDENYSPYLTSSYTQSISQDAMRLHLVQSLTAEQLQTAYGAPVPLSIEPEPIAPTPPSSSPDILTEIAETGTLKAAIRTDAPPFGYLDSDGQWTGYCFDLLNALRQDLTQAVNRPVEIELVLLPSNLENRFQLVQDQTVQLECGPNTIRQDIEGIAFSQPFFYTGTQFLVAQDTAASWNSQIPPDLRIGALANTTTEQFLQRQYAQSPVTYFDGTNGTQAAIDALNTNTIDAFANDSILLRGELIQQQLPAANYALFPQEPLTCDAYGLILPADDRAWRNQISAFLNSEQSSRIRDQWLTASVPEEVSTLEYCLDRQDEF